MQVEREEQEMSLHQRTAVPELMSHREFRDFQVERPGRERWELIDGHPVVMAPPSIDHNRIASNLDRLLYDALLDHDPSRAPAQRCGVDLGILRSDLLKLGLKVDYAPEPDVAVIESEPRHGRRIIDQAFLLAKVVSSSDDAPIAAGSEKWIEVKSDLYRAHAPCAAIVVIEQDRVEVRLDTRGATGWSQVVLQDLDDEIGLPTFGLRCRAETSTSAPISIRVP
jgi:Uma2 family endonuclease